MTEEKIIDGNSIIALFMGFNQVIDNNRVYFKVNDYFSELINYEESETFNDFIRDKELKFNSDWNWLMPVIEKCHTSPAPTKEGWSKAKRIEWQIDNNDIWRNNIIGVWESVIKFITWYSLEEMLPKGNETIIHVVDKDKGNE